MGSRPHTPERDNAYQPVDDARITGVLYDWIVKFTMPRMHWFAPILRLVVTWNREKVMAWYLEGSVANGPDPTGHIVSLLSAP